MDSFLRAWYRGHVGFYLVAPLTLLFYLLSTLRRKLYKAGVLKSTSCSAKVIVVGNISVGGNGKTPVVLALASYYQNKGLDVGILSRGYGGKSPSYPKEVTLATPASEVGDEPKLLKSRANVTVVVDPVRARGAEFLASELGCDIIICDDGMQHYALQRDVEIVVMDERRLGSGLLLPMGPLREGRWRLDTVDAIIHNTSSVFEEISPRTKEFGMVLEGNEFVSVACPERVKSVDSFVGGTLSAIAGIGYPQRFFDTLKSMGLTIKQAIPFVDHHSFEPSDIPSGTVLMTEKDAVKVTDFAHEDCWYLPVTATIAPEFYEHIDNLLAFSANEVKE
ncbi:tetraacyldisaccharide 4'-kinase [Alteromonas sp. KUL49]|uniref:tetraacyldisaccharide 4'-kinase n=1 Tax=Alteromonas sp. KUL49 TaxID=2480798 RepID=UPI00102F10E7|nr:tetraacyldisaccharide 4'-kinase [Alteromonas sp. KUL49]TAP35882.1 tetraacyldisaccharide 4'-kinase [Alteromonas sp. KUL49]GEA13266.1 tetraacyldisaccharide 4'-kinase [Alteromonas sp. KUL49]